MKITLRKATFNDATQIWEILKGAIARRKADGSEQWQDGYPNPKVIESDIENEYGFVLLADDHIAGYAAIIKNDEPCYAEIEGAWLSHADFLVVHRVAISQEFLGLGLAKQMFLLIEKHAKSQNVFSIKVDTNFDNPAMLKVFENLGYRYCGKVYFRGNPRRAYEKMLEK